jgi:hypothetical protein
VAIVPFTVASFVGPAGADTASDCDAAFAAPTDSHLAFTTDPPERYARIGQTVSLTAGWDPAAWDSLTSAVACVRLNDANDSVLGTTEAAPADTGAFDHSFTVPEDAPQGSVLCTRIRLAGDPAGPATDAVWVSKTHCFEVDTEVPDVTPPGDSSSPAPPVQPAASPGPGPAAAPEVPAVAAPAVGTGSPDSGVPPVFSPEGGGSAPGTSFEEAGAPPVAGAPVPPSAAKSSAPRTPEYLPLLPATGFAASGLLHAGERSLASGLALLVLCGRRRRRSRPQLPSIGLPD